MKNISICASLFLHFKSLDSIFLVLLGDSTMIKYCPWLIDEVDDGSIWVSGFLVVFFFIKENLI